MIKFIKTTLLVVATAFATFAFTYVVTDIKPAIGDMAPEIDLPSHNGKKIKLSQTKGNVVLIDFWASWCRTCRVENKNYTKAYQKFKNKKFKNGQGFDIFSISLDTDKEAWKRAITNDHLSWDNHVSDFLKWKSPIVTTYNFRYLPHNLVIDGEGKVIAKGLFGNALDKFLTEQLAD